MGHTIPWPLLIYREIELRVENETVKGLGENKMTLTMKFWCVQYFLRKVETIKEKTDGFP